MGIFSRFRDIVNSNINAMLDKAEDPEKMIKLMIREMEDTLIELKVTCAGVIAEKTKVTRRAAGIVEKVDLWQKRAELAVSKGRDDLAREALMERRNFAEAAEALENELNEHTILIQQYQDDINELEAKLQAAKDKKRSLVQRHKRAETKKRAHTDMRKADSAESMARFDHLESRIERMEAEADMVNFGKKPTVEEEFSNLATDEEIEKELEKLKASKYNSSENTSHPE